MSSCLSFPVWIFTKQRDQLDLTISSKAMPLGIQSMHAVWEQVTASLSYPLPQSPRLMNVVPI